MPARDSEWGFGSEQSRPVEQSHDRGVLSQLRDGVIAAAREQIQDAVEAGKAEQAGHMAIDVSARVAEKSLNMLPPGTRMVGKFVGKEPSVGFRRLVTIV